MWCRTVMALVRDGADRPAHVTAMLEDITDRKRAERELRRLADHDPLTGLVNRRCFHEELQRELSRIDRHGGRGALLVIDVDRFKLVNDTLGHKAGDDVLCAVAETLRRRLRASDVISRIGGDEFAVVVSGVNDRDQAQNIAAKLGDGIREQTILAGGRVAQVTVSIGVAMLDPDTLGPHDDLLVAADNAMYQAKRGGRDRIALAA
jgi:diguanylate cyclase (GGDEF)-like protein